MAERPTQYNEALAAEICSRLADGELLCDICRPTRMPSRDTVRRWQSEHGPFRDRYAVARVRKPAVELERSGGLDRSGHVNL
jgi:hypothetical protein